MGLTCSLQVAVEDAFPLNEISKVCHEKMKIVHYGIPLIGLAAHEREWTVLDDSFDLYVQGREYW